MAISTLESSSATSTTTQTSGPQTTSDVQQTAASTIDVATFASQSTAAAPTSTDTSKSSTSSSTALAAGLGVGIPVVLILMGLVAFFFYRLGQRQNRQAHTQEKEVHLEHSDQRQNSAILVDAGYPDGSQHNEALLRGLQIGDRGLAAEMAHQRSPVELERKRLV
ncbi:hypothetical protein diail_7442 [Diaporthe ilicicola]|nr:hypothetical protein diail_7442 [Diaporthe ilicicola]